MPRSDLRTGISCLHYEWQTLDEAFVRAHSFGLDLIEFSTTSLDGPQYAECARLAAADGLGVSLHAWNDPAGVSVAQAVSELRDVLARCVEMTASHLILHLGSHSDRAAGLRHLIDVFNEVGPDFEQAQVRLCLENHYPYDYHGLNELGGDPSDFLNLFEHVTPPAVGFCLDYGHSNMAGNTEAFIATLAPWLAYTHIADNLGEYDDHLGPEDGTVDWPKVLALTLQTGFRGPFTIEFPEQDDPGRFQRFLQVLQAAAPTRHSRETPSCHCATSTRWSARRTRSATATAPATKPRSSPRTN